MFIIVSIFNCPTQESSSGGGSNKSNRNPLFVAVGLSGRISLSTDGINWTTDQYGLLNLFGITYGEGKFVVVGETGRRMISVDGITWTNDQFDGGNDLLNITYGNGKFVAVGSGGRRITSVNGITWENDISGGNDLYDIAYKEYYIILES